MSEVYPLTSFAFIRNSQFVICINYRYSAITLSLFLSSGLVI